MRGRWRWQTGACSLIALCAAGCGEAADEFEDEINCTEPVGQVAFALGTVNDAVSNSCSTTSVWGLSEQIVAQMNCLIPGSMAPVPDRPNMTQSSSVFPFMQAPAVNSLIAALDSKPGSTLAVTSMFRTVAQQYLLWRWGQSGSCGIGLAATPGNSNHEAGLAFDTSSYSTWRATLEAHDFTWYGSADAVHFTYTGPGALDLRGYDVLAFQQLWNLNHPEDRIDEDGIYGPQTRARLEQSPADGFPTPPSCNQNKPPQGSLDVAGCDQIGGWAYDPDEPQQAIRADVYFGGPAGSGAMGVSVTADMHRDDLCAAIGSCAHGYSMPSPLSLHDGQPHAVHAYGIDTEGADNAELSNSPRTLQCEAQIPPGVRRLVSSAAMQAWHFSPFWDVLPVSESQLAALELWQELADAPVLAKADDNSPTIWLLDAGWRRPIPNPQVAAAWEFDLGAAQVWATADLQALPVGSAVRAAPVLVQAPGSAPYLIDDKQLSNEPLPDGGVGGMGGAGGGTAGAAGTAGVGGDAGAAGYQDAGAGGAMIGDAATWGEAGSGDSGEPSESEDEDRKHWNGSPEPDAEGEGCSCRLDSHQGPSSWSASVLLLGLAWVRRRASRRITT